MRRPIALRTAVLAVLVVAVAGASGCRWIRKGDDVYKLSAENRPLEVPPDLDRPAAAQAMALPGQTSSVSRSTLGTATPGNGFTVAGERDAVFARVGDALAATSGVTIASRAQLLGTYDVDYMGSKFLVRVSRTSAGTYVSAVDPRGVPDTGEAATRLMAALKAAVGG